MSGLKVLVVAATLAAASASAAALPKFSLSDSSGGTHTSAEFAGSRAVVLFFITSDCPISNGYVPEMNRIAQAYSSKGVRFFGVNADLTTPLADVQRHAKDYGFTFPVLLDPQQILIRFTGATITPQAAVLQPAGALAYLGRIDNRVEGFGQQRPHATENDLRDALDQVLTGKTVAKPATKAVGCSIVIGKL
jgi:peroxiredoxin